MGTPGMGKTLCCILDVYPLLIRGVEVWSNVWINYNGKNLHYYDSNDLIFLTSLRNCVIVFDEAVSVLDPRAWAMLPREVRFFFTQRRKFGVDLFFTAQHISLVEKTARITMDYWAKCENLFPVEGKKGRVNKFAKFLPFLLILERELDQESIYTSDDVKFKNDNLFTRLFSMRVINKADINSNLYKKYKIDVNKPLYDSKFIVKLDSRVHFYQAFSRCSCGKTLPYTGARSPEELELIARLEEIANNSIDKVSCSH